MTDYQTFKIGKNFSIEVQPEARGFELSDNERSYVEEIWHQQQKTAPKLHNGQILNCISYENEKMIGEYIEYKYYLAHLLNPSLVPSLQIQPVCISGITTVADKVLIGRRSAHVTNYKQAYETVPSGGISPSAEKEGRIDIIKQFQLELWEETGISVTEIKDFNLFALVFDPPNKQYEICAEISVNYTVIQEELESNEEYEAFTWVSRSEIKAFAAKHSNEFVPLSLYLLKTKGLIKS